MIYRSPLAAVVVVAVVFVAAVVAVVAVAAAVVVVVVVAAVVVAAVVVAIDLPRFLFSPGRIDPSPCCTTAVSIDHLTTAG